MARTSLTAVGIVALAITAGAQTPPREQQPATHDHGEPARQLGTVHFATSCAPGVRPEFDRAVALLHSFWFSAAVESFNAVLKSDPTCVMAHWGIAMSWWSNPFGGFRTAQALQAGLAASDAARAIPGATARERAYVAAVDQLFRDAATRDQRTRTVAYEKAMEALVATYSDDVEARIFYALALGQTALPTDKTYANQLKAASILEEEFARQPEHPGLAHYIIHSFDVPPLASRGLTAARRYSAIAPDAPHALHMPSHTFTRLGLWQDSIDTNLASAAAARRDPGAASEELHALDYQVYAYLQTAQDVAAKRTTDLVKPLGEKIPNAGVGNAAPPSAGYYAVAAIPARYALERAAWEEAAALVPPATPFAFADAVTHFARALGAAHLGRVDAARPDVEKLAALRDTLKKANDGYWTEQVEIQRLGAAAWVALAAGQQTEALALMREAVDREDATEKSAVTPGPIKPARELLGEMLLQVNRPADALAAFEATLKKEPNRFRAVYGAARAATAAGNRASASAHYATLLRICGKADQPARRELTEARAAATAQVERPRLFAARTRLPCRKHRGLAVSGEPGSELGLPFVGLLVIERQRLLHRLGERPEHEAARQRLGDAALREARDVALWWHPHGQVGPAVHGRPLRLQEPARHVGERGGRARRCANALQHLPHGEPRRRTRGVEDAVYPLFATTDGPLAQVASVDELHRIIRRRREHVVTARDAHGPVGEAIRGIAYAHDQAGADDGRLSGEGGVRLLFRQRLQWAVERRELRAILHVRRRGGGDRRCFVRAWRVVLRVDRDRRDEHVVIRATVHRCGGFADPAWARGRVVDHHVPAAVLQRVVVAGLGRPVAKALVQALDVLEQAGIGAAAIEERHSVPTRHRVAHLVRADEAGPAEDQNP